MNTNQLGPTSQMVFGRSPRFREFMETVERFAPLPWPVLLTGETGTGKELLARRIHHSSRRRGFFPINCAAIPATLIESELFGHVKGAFSGANQSQPGLFRQADGGTVFLDELGELPLTLQTKLLRLLDSGEVRPVGSAHVVQVRVRVVAATNVDLAQAVEQKRFRQDLYERLNILPLHVPSLRERREDISLIAAHIGHALGLTLASETVCLLTQAPWPGNVRQLRNFLVRAQALGGASPSPALVRRLLEQLGPPPGEGVDPFSGTLADIEKRVIVDRIRKCRGNRKRAAEELGIAKSTLHEKLRRWREDSSFSLGPGAGTLPWSGDPHRVVV